MLFFPKPNQNNFRWNADADGKAVPNPRPIGNVQLHITHRVQPGDESLVKTRHQPVHAGNHASVRMAGHLKIHAVLKQLLPVLEYQPVVHLLRSLPRIRSRLTQIGRAHV